MYFFSNTQIENQLLVRSKIRMSERSLRIEGRFDQIAELSDLVDRSALEAGFDSRDRYALQLAVCEALENIIIHGYQGESPNPIETHVYADPGEVHIEIWDDAPPFNQAIRPADIDWTEDDPPVGGLGLLIIHEVMDEIHYERKGMRNWLSMRKHLHPKEL
jgi:serine/threonine-protein kinase RsbW